MKTRNQISDNYKWDLSPLCNSDEDFYKGIEKVKDYIQKFKKFENKLKDKETILKFFKLDQEFDNFIEPLYLYVHLKHDEVLSDRKRNEMSEKMSHILSELSIETSFVSTELHEIPDELIDDILKDKRFKDYDRMFESIKKEKIHMLSKQEEKLLAGMNFLGGFSSNMEKLADVDIDFGKIKDSKGKEYNLSQSNYSVFLRSKDRELRKNTITTLNGTFGKYINTLANNYICEVKENCYFAKVRKYNSALDEALFNEEVSKNVYDTLISSVNKNLKVLFDYFKLKKNVLGLNDFYIYDCMAGLDKTSGKKYTYDQAIEIIMEAVKPLGEEYVNLIKEAKEQKWIDVFPNKDKRSGAYETGIYGYHPYVLTNFEGDLDSVFTLAHELGHAMHTHFSNKNQPRPKSEYTIFLAEIASTTNEILLINYFLNKSNSKNEKIYILNKFFDEIKGTIFRQTMFAEFEENVHSSYERGESLTKDGLCEYYYDLNKKYFGKVKLVKEIQYEWARIPHFFNAFYVYKYATGMISAITFVNKILSKGEEAVKDYYKFLTAGSSDTPINILKNANCNLEDEKTFEECFDYLKSLLKEWQKIQK